KSVPFEAMIGQMKFHQNPVDLYTLTLSLPKKNRKELSVKGPYNNCQHVMDQITSLQIATIH
ncbi:hypothetical protein RhiirA5_354792, partial [Rhizophagus irregularis]